MKTSNAINNHLIDRTIEIWQPRLGTPLSNENARQIAENITGFFSILAEWSRAEALDSSNAPSDDPKTQHGGVRHDR
jgi:hypothetical protein